MIDWSQSIPHPLLAARASRGAELALLAPDGRWSYEALCLAVMARAAGFAAQGIQAGDRVALPMTRRGQDVISLHALGWLGACVLPFAASSREQRESLDVCAPDRIVDDQPDAPVSDAPPARPWAFGEARFVLRTSGTTGRARPVTLSTAQVLFSAFGSAMRLGHLPQDCWLAVLPLHHVGGLSVLMRSLFAASAVELHERFDAQAVCQALESGRISQTSLVPTMLDALLGVLPARMHAPNLRFVLLGGAKPSADLLAHAESLGLPVIPTWGMSETASQAATLHPGAGLAPAPPLPFLDVLEEADRLVVRGPAAGGVCVTGDRGHVDALGRVRVTGRADACIISGGENIDPTEIEAVLASHPAVARAYVVGVGDATYGERPAAALVPATDKQPSAAELRTWCGHQLDRFKAPDRILWIKDAPRGETGKVRLAELRDWLSKVQPTEMDGDPR